MDRRQDFFTVLGVADDGRRELYMTPEEFFDFCNQKEMVEESKNYKRFKGKKCVQIYFKFEPYEDVSYSYCFDEDCIVVSRFYIGD